jgi:hypothetical protein
MVLDTSVVTGPISVTNPVGTGLSSFTFTVLKNPRPVLIRIKDVPADQGGLVVLHWLKSYYDRAGYDRITGYRVWRRSILPTANAGLTTPLALQEAGEFWEAIGQFPAAFLQGYAFAAPTLVDSTELASPYTAFAVQAFTANAFEFYFSNVDSGYSVDNLAPAAPLEFVANHSGPNRVVLRWRGSRENDFSTYVLHRGASADFTPAPENLLTSTTDTTVVDGAPLSGMRFYKVAGVDVHGNVGAYSSASPEPPVSTLASLVEAQARPGWARIEWLWNGDASARPTLFRREPRGDWQSLGEVLANHERRIIVEDHPTKSGEHGYQLRLGDRIVAEAWVNVPGAELAIESLAPNPARGSITLSAILQGVPARIEAFDVRGRRALSREIGTLTGRQQITIPEAAQLPAGVYVLRLTAGGRSLTRRFLIVR